MEPWDQIMFRSLLILPHKMSSSHPVMSDKKAEATLEAEDITTSCMANGCGGRWSPKLEMEFTLPKTSSSPLKIGLPQ